MLNDDDYLYVLVYSLTLGCTFSYILSLAGEAEQKIKHILGKGMLLGLLMATLNWIPFSGLLNSKSTDNGTQPKSENREQELDQSSNGPPPPSAKNTNLKFNGHAINPGK